MNKEISMLLDRTTDAVLSALLTLTDEIKEGVKISLVFNDGFGGLSVQLLTDNAFSIMPASQSVNKHGEIHLWNGDGNSRFGRSNVVCGGYITWYSLRENKEREELLKGLKKLINRCKKHQLTGDEGLNKRLAG